MARHRFPRFSQAYGDRFRRQGLWKDKTLHDAFDEKVEAAPDRIVLIDRDRRYSMAEFKEASRALGAGLLSGGIGKGDIVGVQLPNWVEFCFLQIALSRIGAVIQPLHMVFGERELHNLLSFNETDAVVVCREFRGRNYEEQMKAAGEGLEFLRTVIVVERDGTTGSQGMSFDQVMDDGRKKLALLDEVKTDPDDVFYLNFTSGTTGNPKGFLHSHNTLISRMVMMAEMTAGDTTRRVSLACSPMTHSYGHFSTYSAALGGGAMVLVDRYSPTEILEFIERERVTTLSGTPAHIIGIIDHPDFSRIDTSSIKSVGVGGARSAPELIERLERIWGVKTGNTYGMGENLVHTVSRPDDPEEKIRESVGRPVPGVELKIVDANDRSKTLESGQIGEICFRGPTLFVGYHNLPEKTAETRDDDGWFFTGDLGYVDPDGYLYFAGRAQEVINRGGSKIFPKEVEDLLGGHPGVAAAAVVGMPDERLGERVCAFIVPREADVTLEEVAEYLREQKVMSYLIPEALVNVPELPMTPTGKIRKASLQDDAKRLAASSSNTGA
jgi:acyl-CoA synthetase (AMP-forming)/AMP-acid ligase II